LRKGCGAIVSLVVREGSEVIGHAMFSPVTIESGERAVMGMGLGPVAVEPGFQRRGVGKSLISVGLEKVEEVGSPFVVVLGHPEYYPRFGFERASRFGIRCAWDVPDDVFMVRVFDAQAMEGVSGVARYRGEFDAVT